MRDEAVVRTQFTTCELSCNWKAKTNCGAVEVLGRIFRRKPQIEQIDVTRALAKRFGEMDEVIGHASVPLSLGGSADVAWFRNGSEQVVCTTTDLATNGSQLRNTQGNYELVIITENKDEFAANLISQLAPYTFEAVLGTGQTMDIGEATPEESTLSALYFEALEPLKIHGHQIGLLLCFGITESELSHYLSGDESNLIQSLEEKGIFPLTSWERPSLF